VGLLDHTHIPPESRVVIACSGGGDSVALLHMLADGADRHGWRLTVAHLDHGLREESSHDATFTASCASRLGLPCIVERRDVEQERRPGESIEAAARRIRYDFLHHVRDREAPGGVIATGHTADDQLETVAMRLERGAGMRGLRAILPARGDGVVRPLLAVRRGQLRAWMQAREIAWREDASNVDVSYRRNRWRQLFGQLPSGRYDDLLHSAGSVSRRANRLHPIMYRLAGWWLDNGSRLQPPADGPPGSWKPLPGEIILERLPVACHFGDLDNALLETALEALGADPRRVHLRVRRELIRLWRSDILAAGSGGGLLQLGERLWAESVPAGLMLARSADPHWERDTGEVLELRLPTMERPEPVTVELPSGGSIEAGLAPMDVVEGLAGGTAPDDVDGRRKVVVDAGAVGTPVTIRYARAGDRMQPLGMEGHKHLSDLFNEEGIPRLSRGRLPVVAAGGEILWVAGVRSAHPCRVGPATKQGVTLRFNTYYKRRHRNGRT